MLEPGLRVNCPPEAPLSLDGPAPLDGTEHWLSCASQGSEARVGGTCEVRGGQADLVLRGEAYYPCDSDAYVRPTATLRAALGPGRYSVSVLAGEGPFGSCAARVGELAADPMAPGPGLTSVFDQAVDGDRTLAVTLDCTEALAIGGCYGAQGVVLGLSYKEEEARLALRIEPEAP